MSQHGYTLDEFPCQFNIVRLSLAGTAVAMRFENYPEGRSTNLEDSDLGFERDTWGDGSSLVRSGKTLCS